MNGGILDRSTFTAAASLLQSEVVDGEDFEFMSIGDTIVFASIPVMRKHNLNATDAAILALLLAYSQLPGSERVAVVASDKRQVRAASLEDFLTVNPEEMAVADVPVILHSL
jgi:hypothetical protein